MADSLKIEVITASTRPGRLGGQIGAWIAEYAKAHSNFDISVSDLAELNLPVFDEPGHPMMGEYTKDHSKDWSRRIGAADGFIIVTPEYNYTMPPSLLNAIDFLHHEWKYKPAGFVGYGGTGALRAVQTARLVLSNLSVVTVARSVNLMATYAPLVTTFAATDADNLAADKMLEELEIWAAALKPLHTK